MAARLALMMDAPAPVLARIADWPVPVCDVFWSCRAVFQDAAKQADVGTLEESLKWGQPAWRPARPRTGSTLRLFWTPSRATVMQVFVDCKTDLAARMQTLYPDLCNDGRRRLEINIADALPEQGLAHLAQMTFTYHRTA